MNCGRKTHSAQQLALNLQTTKTPTHYITNDSGKVFPNMKIYRMERMHDSQKSIGRVLSYTERFEGNEQILGWAFILLFKDF